MAGKSKYETHVLPFLPIIKGWCRKGAVDEDIAKKLGVAYSTLRMYRRKFPELDEAMKTSKELADIEIENALFTRATGYSYYEEAVTVDEDGKKTVRQIKHHIPGDVKAQQFWLKNRKPEDWNDKHQLEVSNKLEDLL